MQTLSGQGTSATAKGLKHSPSGCPKELNIRIHDTEVLTNAWMQSVHRRLNLTRLRWSGHVARMHYVRLQKKGKMENFRYANDPKVARRNGIKTHLKPTIMISTYMYNQRFRKALHRIEQTSERRQTTTKQGHSAKLNKSKIQDIIPRAVIFKIDLLYF